MKIKIGSKVKFLNDVGGGIIKGFTDDKIAMVECPDGFVIPILVTDLVIDEGNAFDEDNEIQTAKGNRKQEADETKAKPVVSFEELKFAPLKGEVLIALKPENIQLLHVSNFGLYLINESNYYFNFVLSTFDKGTHTLVKTGLIKPNSKSNVKSITQSDIAKIQNIRLQGIYYKQGLFQVSQVIDLNFNIGNISFYKVGYFTDNNYFDSKALILKKEEIDIKEAFKKLTESEIAKVTRQKESAEKKVMLQSPKKENTVEEIDLHIEALVDDHRNMSNGEIIETQLNRFEAALQTAIISKVQKIVFIHGVGNGKLKQEIINKLNRKYPDFQYQDASFKEYGFGATMVYIK
jgi:hypothetical protein